ncbi:MULTISPECIES: type II toxin-antitoxin system VapC family toxin [Methylobacterium]|uniref:Ribonuclease VapC n=2 Tax=Methylobacterium TaxID=407 RepID=A0A0C6EYR6_9HYPH|nr:type II toxin-antitoxin system VapC family toxin [Methylobacterium aquaticum]BAQ45386.1 twitching motility protein PilT [Methylobacterium aquaticum]
MYLVDTNVVSAAAPTQAAVAPDLVAWMDRNSAHLYLSVITVAEIEAGIAKSRRQGAHRKAERLAEWLAALLHLYGARVLPIDLDVAWHLGCLTDRARGQGLTPDLADLAIAATAQSRKWSVLTRNLRHFSPLGVPAHDPFAALPPDATSRSLEP